MPIEPHTSLGPVLHDDARRVADAKARLLDWGSEADLHMRVQIAELRESVLGGARRARPWGFALAAGAGLIGAMLFKGRGRSRREPAAGSPGSDRLPIGQIVGLVRVLAPILLPLLMKRRER